MNILDDKKSDILRDKYINAFVDTNSPYFKENIEQKTMFCDGLCYTGYLWDSLIVTVMITEAEADRLLQEKQNVFVMWDIHSCERILIPNYWKFPKSSILFAGVWLENFKSALPEDVYIFDETFSWSVIYTHETDSKDNRYCLYTHTRRQV